MALLEVQKVDFGYYGSNFALRDVNLHLSSGERLVLYGFEGSGKTTLLRLLCGLEEYSQGSILLDGVELKDVSQKDMNIGFTFDRRILDSKSTVSQVISYPMKLRQLSPQQIDSYLEEVSIKCNLPMQSTVKGLSDMQVALLILARLFAVERRLYLIDDVWKDLSLEEKDVVTTYLLDKIKDRTVIIATDDSNLAKSIATDKIIVLSGSQVAPMLSVENISKRPINMQSAIFAGYELHIGELVKDGEGYFANLYGKLHSVSKPMNDIYVGKKVCFALMADGQVKNFYYDLDNERIITL